MGGRGGNSGYYSGRGFTPVPKGFIPSPKEKVPNNRPRNGIALKKWFDTNGRILDRAVDKFGLRYDDTGYLAAPSKEAAFQARDYIIKQGRRYNNGSFASVQVRYNRWDKRYEVNYDVF